MAIDPLILLGTAVGVLVGLSVITLLYLERTKDRRIRKARKSKGLDSDNEAYNAVQSAKSISSIMKRKGRDTEEAEMTLDRAEMALESNNYSKAKSLAEEAKGKMQSPTSTTNMTAAGSEEEDESGDGKTGTKKAYTEDDLDVLETKASGSKGESEKRKEFKEQKEKIQSLPDNYLESRFEIRQARSKLKETEGEPNKEAKEALKKARDAFESEDYSKALSLSIECKKKIGSGENEIIKGQKIGEQKEPDVPEEFEELETLGGSEEPQAQGITRTKETEADREQQKEPETVEEEIETGGTEEGMEDKLAELEELGESEVEEEVTVEREREVEEKRREEKEEEVGEVEETLICPDCGNEGREGDKFCNKCGTELILKLNCPGCGAEVQEEDRFCPKCGIELTPITYACPDCGAEIEREAQFCPQCGVEFE